MNKLLHANIWLAVLMLLSAASPIEKVRQRRVFLSQDNGYTWRVADTGFPADDGINTMILHNKRVFAGTNTHGILALDKNGWYAQSAGLPRESRVISLLSDNPLLYAGVFRQGLYYSSDQGQTWQLVPGGPPQVNIRALIVYAGAVYAGSDHGLYRIKLNGAKWELVIETVQINAFTFDSGYIYAATQQGLVRSRDGKSWESIYNDGAIYKVGQYNGEILMLDYSGHVYKSFADKAVFILQDYFLPHVYFRLNPVSTKIFTGEWPGIPTIGPDTRRGLPADVPLNSLLQTSEGLLAAGPSFGDGC